jgi:molybdopterin synthase catalytic subunit
MSEKKRKPVFVKGPISPEKVASSIASHQSKTDIGAHQIFLGQVRADEIEGKRVAAIEYSAYEEMAEEKFYEIREAAFAKYDISCLHIYHSLGTVRSGEISLFVFTSSKHRHMATDACRYLVEEIKAKVPIFGKEIFDDQSHTWKSNSK